ncbi:TonB-dependent receptor [Chitinophagaceae bacterium LB-8]|uniref:TonB-dependent receptor n=1 Tax=Paraflavisolibacter caeni TaxID=2982496 RepID=A0A9X3BIJ6_9BACT|nr:TonB-dependent receptor [Paraflavisolibacter caeni]MCU7551497.1 TonB-dependent receptor [Paraflavisolibacter caeni]
MKKGTSSGRFIHLSIKFSILLMLFTALRVQAKDINGLTVAQNASENREIRVAGKVTGANDEPLSGVSVREKGTSSGTSTDNNGMYALTVDNNAILQFSYIGYETQEVPVSGQSVINVKLVVATKQMEQVVVIGYGTQNRRNVTGSISTVHAEDFENRPIFSTAQAIQGKAAGVQVTQPSGKPGTDFSVRIRGTSSINANNDPLYVIDGVQTTDTRGLNTNDIETIQILKDAASTAIYGARAAGGVVIITTKRGRSNQSLVSFNTYVGFSKVVNTIDVLNTPQYRELMEEVLGPGTVDPSITTNTNWVDEVFNTGVNQNYQASVSGGSDKAQYFLSMGYLKDKGVVEPARFDRYSVRLNLDNKVKSWLKVNANLNYIRSSFRNTLDNLSSGRGGVILSALNTPPFLNVYKSDGSGQFDPNPFQPSWENPVAYQSRDERSKDNRFLGNLGADISFARFLSYKANFAVDISNTQFDSFIDPFRTSYGRQQNGIGTARRDNLFTWLWENTLNYNQKFGSHNVIALGGISIQEKRLDNAYVEAQDYPSIPGVQTINVANQINNAGTTASESALASFFGRLLYDYNSKYLFTAAFRYDGSSKLAEGNQWQFFPSFSGGWRISSEPFMQGVDFINDLKLRVGWGQTGNQEGLGDYAWRGLFNTTRKPVTNPLSGPAIYRNTIENPDLKWETTTQTNIGLDAAILNHKVNITADAYWKKTKDLLLAIPLPNTVGVGSNVFDRNDGVLENKGFELAISSPIIDRSDLKWNADFNISFNDNEIKELGLNKIYDFATVYSNNQQVIRVTPGQPLGAFYGYISEGVDPATGKLVFRDLNDDKIITPDDRTFIGYALPKFIYGLTTALTYKNFDLNVFFQGVQGNDIFNATRVDLEGMFDSKNQSTVVLNRWKTPGQVTDIPKANDPDNYKNSTRFIENGSYLRLKSLTLAYNFNKDLVQKLHLQKLMLYVTGQNVFTITDYSGFDPEVNAFGSNSKGTEIGVDYGTYPQTRTFIFGLNVDF